MNDHPLSPKLSRRALLQKSGLGLLGVSLAGRSAAATATATKSSSAAKSASASASAGALTPLNRFGRMVQEYYVGRVRDVEIAANARRAKLRSKGDAEAYVRTVREKIQSVFGPWP